MAVNNNLYPPIVNTYAPVFIIKDGEDAKCKIPVDFSSYNSPISKFEICQYISRYILFCILISLWISISNKFSLIFCLPYPYTYPISSRWIHCPYIPSFCFMDKGTG